MKKLFVLISISLLVMFIFSCKQSPYMAGLHSKIKILDENGKPVSNAVFENLKGEIVTKETTKNVHLTKNDAQPPLHFLLTIDLGSSYKDKEIKKIRASYSEKMKLYGIKITDTSGKYEDIILSPLPSSDYTVISKDYGYPNTIEYTVQLKKK